MECIRLTRADFELLKVLQVQQRWDWPAIFSTNPQGDIWPFVTWGLTPEEVRHGIRGLSKVVDEVADAYVCRRHLGGRFFIDESGAFHKNGAGRTVKFAYFLIRPCGESKLLILENYTFLTSRPSTQRPNVYACRKGQKLITFSNNRIWRSSIASSAAGAAGVVTL